ncbi:MAG: dUTP diphosphatase [Sarcina sp.]
MIIRNVKLTMTKATKDALVEVFAKYDIDRIPIYGNNQDSWEPNLVYDRQMIKERKEDRIIWHLDPGFNLILNPALTTMDKITIVDNVTFTIEMMGLKDGDVTINKYVRFSSGEWGGDMTDKLVTLDVEMGGPESKLVVIDTLPSIKVINESNNPLPKYETKGAAGMDLMAYLPEGPVILKPGQRTIIPTGLKVEIPAGYDVDIRPRSGNAIKFGITVLNTPGLIDEDFRGVIGVILINHGSEDFVVNSGDKIAQMTIGKVFRLPLVLSEVLSETERGENGFGSTDAPLEKVEPNDADPSECACGGTCGDSCDCKSDVETEECLKK